MKRRLIQGAILALAVSGITVPTLAADQTSAKDQTQARDQIRDQDIYGSQLMTAQERDAHRNKMRAAKTEQERERIRAEHHEQMKVRRQGTRRHPAG